MTSKERSPEPPKKHLPGGCYARADWFEAECIELQAALARLDKRRSTDPVDMALVEAWNKLDPCATCHEKVDLLMAERDRLQAQLIEKGGGKCMARPNADPPTDCDAPFCGCNPAWSDCMQMLEECGYLKTRDEVLNRPAPETPAPQCECGGELSQISQCRRCGGTKVSPGDP